MRKSTGCSLLGAFALTTAASTWALRAQPAQPLQNTEAIIRQAVAVNTQDWEAQLRYSYSERDIKAKLDSAGNVQSSQSKTCRISIQDGSPYEELLEVNSEPISHQQRLLEAAKRKTEITERRNESPSKRHARVSKFENTRADEHLLMEQMALAFRFRLIGNESVNGAECYRLAATPKPDYVPPVEKARVLLGMRGEMWIDKLHFHWVKVKAQVTQPVSFGFFIAQVKPGTQFELDQMPVGGNWLPRRFVEKVNASVFGFYGYRSQVESIYSGYEPTGVTAREVADIR